MSPDRRNKPGIFLIITRTESIKAAQLESQYVETTPPRGTKSIHSVSPYDTVSHQPLYSEEIFM